MMGMGGGMAAPMGPPPGIPMGAAPGQPPMGGGMPMDEDQLLIMLLQAVMGKWQGDEAQLSGEKDVLMQTLMMLAQGSPAGPGAFAEGAGMM